MIEVLAPSVSRVIIVLARGFRPVVVIWIWEGRRSRGRVVAVRKARGASGRLGALVV